MSSPHRSRWVGWPPFRRLLGGTEGSQIAEFAFALPLIIVFVVGIFDFSQAFGLKAKLSNAAREGARVGANQPTNDLSQTTPATVAAIAREVGTYLQSVGVNDCGLASGTYTATKILPLKWRFRANTGCGGNTLRLTIDRGFLTTATLSAPYSTGPTVSIQNTEVTVQYPYKWQFGNVISLLVPGTTYAAGTTQIQAVATMQNLN